VILYPIGLPLSSKQANCDEAKAGSGSTDSIVTKTNEKINEKDNTPRNNFLIVTLLFPIY
jgi:hypothetical protein